MKKETLQRRVGRDGKYPGLFSREKRSWSSADSGIEKTVRDFFAAPRPTIAETINHYESHALAIIEAEGYEFQKPYRFNAELIGSIETDIRAEILEKNPDLEKSRAKAEGSLTRLGCAAQILKECHELRRTMEAGSVENTAHNAMLLQHSIDYLNFMQWEYPARVGEAQLIAKNVAYTDEDKADWTGLFNEKRKKQPKISKRKAADEIASKLGHKSETIRKYI